MNEEVCIGVFDSGLGGLSVLRAIRARLPQAHLLYVADSGHAPYGERPPAYVQTRSLAIAAFLRSQRADLMVVACNTATAAASALLRERYPAWQIVGVEPGLKPAATATRNGRIGVLATEGTLGSEKFKLLAQAHAAHLQLFLQPCPGLAAAIEHGDADAPAVREHVQQCCAPLLAQRVDTVVLGCTHYPFVAHHIQAAMGPQVTLIDTADAVARRTEALSPEASATDALPGTTRLWTTGHLPTLQDVARHWLPFTCETALLTLPAND
ncbi:MAG: glutamate racemase [Burkholderiales bacterium]